MPAVVTRCCAKQVCFVLGGGLGEDDAMDPCMKCGGRMEQGFVVDHQTHGARAVARWIAGAPRKSFWWGLKTSGGSLPIGVFRCARCGYLESYARAEFAAE